VSEARWAWSGQYNGEETRAGGYGWRYQALAQIDCSGEQTPKSVIHRFLQVLFTSEVPFRRQNRGVAEKELDLFNSPPLTWQSFAHVLRRSCGAR
jgi:hypothetical protein